MVIGLVVILETEVIETDREPVEEEAPSAPRLRKAVPREFSELGEWTAEAKRARRAG
jgi:hypothetical protein